MTNINTKNTVLSMDFIKKMKKKKISKKTLNKFKEDLINLGYTGSFLKKEH